MLLRLRLEDQALAVAEVSPGSLELVLIQRIARALGVPRDDGTPALAAEVLNLVPPATDIVGAVTLAFHLAAFPGFIPVPHDRSLESLALADDTI
jgi:hypothetical protein